MKQAATGRFHSAMGEPYHTVSRLVDLASRLRQVVAGNEKRAADRGAALEEIERPFVPAPRGSLLDPPPTWALGEVLLALLPQRSGPSPAPPERPAPDPKREEYSRDRDKSSSKRVDQ